MINVHVHVKAKIAYLLMKDNNGTDKKPNELHQNYHTMKLNKSQLPNEIATT